MSGCLALVEDGNGENAVLAGALQQEGGDEEGNKQGRDGGVNDENGNVNEEEEDDEDEDVDFNPFLKETNSLEASSSLSSEVEDLDADVADSGGKSKEKGGNVVGDCHTGVNVEHGEDIVLQTVVDVCEKGSGVGRGTDTEKETVLITELNDKENGSASLADVTDSRKSGVKVDDEGAICMRTRARYSLASFSLDELETFLQETDDEDDLQNVDDEEEYRKFLAAVLRGDDSQSLQENANADDDEDEENDADFELELEEALESEPDEVEERRVTRRDRRQKASVERGKKPLGQLNRPLRPLLPFASAGSFPAFDGKHLAPNTAPTYLPTVNNGFTCGFTPHQIGKLHCLIHEHVQLLVQVFSVCVLEPLKRHVAAEVKELILEMLRKRDQVLAWRTLPYPSFCFLPPYVHPSVPDELHNKLPPNGSNKSLQWDFPSRSTGELQSDVIALPNERYKHQPDGQAVSLQNLEFNSWVPYICGPLMSVIDVAPLRLVESYIDDVSSAVQAYERYQIELGSENLGQKEPLFPLHNSSSPAESDGHGETENTPPGSSGTHSSSTCNQIQKKTMAATLLEKAKNQPVALVHKEIAKLAQRFWPLFNPTLYPHKPPPAPLANRVLFTDAEDELLALGLMEYNTDWKAIQQRFLPCKSKHQIFVRQKNRASSKAPENPIKAVRRMKNAPLTSEEMACIEVGLKKYKLDWISIWRSFVPYRDPSLLPRQWRIASGTQKSYKSDANKKAKRRLYELRRKSSKPSPSTLHYSCEKEGDSTDNGVEEANSGDNHMEKEDEAYVHEAFLADWRPDDNASSDYSTRLPFHGGSQTEGQKDNSGSGYIQSQMWSKSPATLRPSSSQIVLRPYRARKMNSARVVKLAPNLPPVNLPPSVRVISQSAFKSSQAEASTKISGDASRPGAENGTTNSACHYSVKSGHIGSNSFKITANNHQPKHSEVLIDKCVAGRGDPDLQMHPLLFQTLQDGRLPYYPLNCSPSTPGSFTFFPGKQPQLSLSLFHNPRHIRDAVNFLSKSSKPPEKNGSSFGVDFHPLLQRTDDVETVPSSTEPRQRCSSSGSGAKVGRKANELDLDIHLSFTSNNQEAAGSRDMSGNTASDPISKTMDFETAKVSSKKRDSAPDGNSNKVDSGDLAIITNREKGSRRVSEVVDESSLPEIIMEQEELSDSEEEFGENVEFECEEMADSEGDSTSDSEQLVDIPDEEVQLDEIDADNGNHRALNVQSDSGGNRCSTSNGLAENGVNNIKPNAQSLNLNSRPPVSPHSNPKNAVAGYEVGPFGTRGTLGQDKIPSNSKRSSRHVKKSDTQKRSRDAPDHPRKRACRSSSKSSNAVAGKGNTSSNMGTTIENSKNVSTDELS